MFLLFIVLQFSSTYYQFDMLFLYIFTVCLQNMLVLYLILRYFCSLIE